MTLPDERILLRSSDVRRAFGRAARNYDASAVLQREVGDRLLNQLQYMQIDPARILDLGAGTGYCARALEARFKRARIVLLDLAPSMLVEARSQQRTWFSRLHYLCSDANHLGIQTSTVDLIFSNLMIQWCTDLPALFAECKRVLRPGGLLLFSTLGPDTLHELREAWAAVDERPHVNVFLDMHDVGDALITSGLSAPVLDRENITVTYQDMMELMRDLKAIGAHNSLTGRQRGLTGKAALTAVRRAYERHRRADTLPATYEIIYGHAWAPSQNTRAQDGSTVATFPFKQITKRTP